jgi:hypothetical protein
VDRSSCPSDAPASWSFWGLGLRVVTERGERGGSDLKRLVLIRFSSALVAWGVLAAGIAEEASTPGVASAHGRVFLGSKDYEPYGKGWGKVKPKTIFNGGDLNGLIKNVHWKSWGGRVARGHGRNSIFKPQGGYYRHPVRIKLKAHALGHCPGSSRRAYRKLSVRVPRKPGGRLRPWLSWSGSATICGPT